MPGEQHERLVELFKARPELALTALREWLGIEVPHWTEVETVDSDANQAQPLERRADLAHVLSDGGRPVLAVVVEVQRHIDDAKRWSWPYYAAAMSSRHECPAVLLVVTPSPKVADWADQPLDTGPCSLFWPVVLGPSRIPQVTDASAEPELLMLSATAHAELEPSIVTALLRRLDGVDQPLRDAYARITLALVAPTIREEVERMLKARDYPVDSWAQKYVAIGEARGEARGEAKGEANFLLHLLARRFGEVSDEIERRVRSADSATVRRWGDLVVDGHSLEGVFADD
jgi:hypothetical protein